MAENKQATTLKAQVSKISVDSKGALRLEISIPLHIAINHAAELLDTYSGHITITLA